jgi:perosamine synthetase
MSSRFIPVATPVFHGNEKKYVADCIDTAWISGTGKYIEMFESSFAEFCGVENAISCSSGTTALHLALLALGVRQGDEVICPTFTYIATANAVTYCGATPVFVDSEPETWNLDPAAIERIVTPRTKAIIVVHIYGQPVDMDPVMAVARKHGLFVGRVTNPERSARLVILRRSVFTQTRPSPPAKAAWLSQIIRPWHPQSSS